MRNLSLLAIRDTKILQRYNEMYFEKLMRDEEIYKVLEQEFFIKQKTIYEIVLRKSKEAAAADLQSA